MHTIAVTGANGRIGRALCASLGDACLPITRQGNDRAHPSNLVAEPPRLRAGVEAPVWLVHLATAHGPDDVAMMRNALAFCEAAGVPNVVFLSTWSVLFPKVGTDAAYTLAKRECERILRAAPLARAVVVRPSVVVGKGEQQWDAVLARLAPLGPLLGGLHRCFVSVDVVVSTLTAVVSEREARDVITLLGARRSLQNAAPPSRLAGPVAALVFVTFASALCFAAATLRSAPPWAAIAAAVATVALFLLCRRAVLTHSFTRSFVRSDVCPRDATDALSLTGESGVSVRGENNKNLFFSPRSNRPSKTIVSLRYLDEMRLDADESTVYAGAGVTFRELLPYLRSRGVALQNYPNYHTITIGACVATPVHGSDLRSPFIVDLIQSFSYAHAGQMHEVDRANLSRFYQTIFHLPQGAIVVAARLRIQRGAPRYRLETRKVDPADLSRFLREAPHDAACEVRQNTPGGDMVATIFRSVEDCEKCVELKADGIGSFWNNIGYFLPVARAVSRAIVNFEWFVRPDQLADLVRELRASPFYKLLYRYNRAPDAAASANPFYDTVSIDVSCPLLALGRARALYDRFKPREHSGKHMIGRAHERVRAEEGDSSRV